MLTSVVLMAGYSRRMGTLKQHVVIDGKTFLSHIIDKLEIFSTSFITKIFVGQESDLQGQEQVRKYGGTWISNLNPDEGTLSSIRLAVDKTPSSSSIMIWPTDHPLIKKETIASLIHKWEENPESIILPSDGDHRGHPAIFPNWILKYFYSIDTNKGAKALLQMFPEKIKYVLTDDIWITRNINTPELLIQAEEILLKDK